jgi:hypothetical protein
MYTSISAGITLCKIFVKYVKSHLVLHQKQSNLELTSVESVPTCHLCENAIQNDCRLQSGLPALPQLKILLFASRILRRHARSLYSALHSQGTLCLLISNTLTILIAFTAPYARAGLSYCVRPQ